LIDRKNILYKKCDEEENLACYKARYIIQGFKQKFSIDYTEIFVPKVHSLTLRLLLSIPTQKYSTVAQADARNTYLHSYNNTDEVFYMSILSG